MALRLKTVEYYFPVIATYADGAITNFTQITTYLPEATKTFRSAVLEIMSNDIITNTGGSYSARNAQLSLGGAAYTVVSNASVLTNTGQCISLCHTFNFTSHFATNWTGASMTCDARVQLTQSSGTTRGQRDITAKLTITYEYDDTATTHVKTVWIPLNAPTGALATAKPGTATATIPALDTFCPEASKTFRQTTIVVQGNDQKAASIVDYSLSMAIDAAPTTTTGLREGYLASDRWFRYTWQPTFTTNATHGFFIWASLARANHLQVWMVVTYEFNATTTTSVLNSLLVPMDFEGPADGTTATNFQRANRTLWIEEPGTISIQQSAFQLYWQQAATLTAVAVRIGAGAFVSHADTGALMCGGSGLQIRSEGDVTLGYGLNNLQADVYRTNATNYPGNMSGLWILNYTSSKHADGVGAHNHTVRWNIFDMGAAAAAKTRIATAMAPVIPETNYYITALANHYQFLTNNAVTVSAAGVSIQTERLAGEGGLEWVTVYSDICEDDPEVGLRQCYSQARDAFKRNPNDPDTDRIDIETARRYRVFIANTCTANDHLDLLLTYHSIATTRTGNITASAGNTVQIRVYRADNNELIYSTSRVGAGTFSFPWYDNSIAIYAEAYENATHYGRSVNAFDGTNLDISLNTSGGTVVPLVRAHA